MAKIASSKPYGIGNKNKEKESTNELPVSPIRTSPRRRKSTAEEVENEAVQIEKVRRDKKKSKPVAPKFNETKKKNSLDASGAESANTKSPKTLKGRRKSLIEPVFVEQAETPEEQLEDYSDDVDENIEEVEYDHVGSVQSSIYSPEPVELERKTNSPL